MIIQINTGSQVERDSAKTLELETVVTSALERFIEKITRIELHLTDENSAAKGGADDKRCRIEVRIAGMKPLEVTHNAATIEHAVDGALEKLERVLDTKFEKLRRH